MNEAEITIKITEEFASLCHEEWCEWSQKIAETEKISPDRLARWKTLWKPYSMLTEEEKELDRKYAKKFVKKIKRFVEIEDRIRKLEKKEMVEKLRE